MTATTVSLDSPADTIPCASPVPALIPDRPWYLPCKMLLDWLAALCLLTVVAPLVLVLGILVRATSRGPVFYGQNRLGFHGRIYRMYKLRTMVHNAESASGPVWAAKSDHRVTPLGYYLRSTHLDELPQLWNVLRGEMSLIGPRPERPELAARIERFAPTFNQRLGVRPGITGLAQMMLPADDPNDKEMNCVRHKLAHDLHYVREVSIGLDLRIAICTPCRFLAASIDVVGRSLLQSCHRAIRVEPAQPAEAHAKDEMAA